MKTKPTDRLIGLGGDFYTREAAIEFLRGAAGRWRSLAKDFPHSAAKPDPEAIKLAERNEQQAKELEAEGIALGFLKKR